MPGMRISETTTGYGPSFLSFARPSSGPPARSATKSAWTERRNPSSTNGSSSTKRTRASLQLPVSKLVLWFTLDLLLANLLFTGNRSDNVVRFLTSVSNQKPPVASENNVMTDGQRCARYTCLIGNCAQLL